ncbi:MAG: hypothetical protein WBX15_15200 [Thermoanaerobaculia bacterium]
MPTFQIRDDKRLLEIGRDEQPVATLRRSWFMPKMTGEIEQARVQIAWPAPWNGLRWHLTLNGLDLATATNPREGITRNLATFEVDFQGRQLRLETEDHAGFAYALQELGRTCGGVTLRPFDPNARWWSDFEVPEGLPLAVVSFLACLIREGGIRQRERYKV